MGMVCPECYKEKYKEMWTRTPDDSPRLCDKHIISELEEKVQELEDKYNSAKEISSIQFKSEMRFAKQIEDAELVIETVAMYGRIGHDKPRDYRDLCQNYLKEYKPESREIAR